MPRARPLTALVVALGVVLASSSVASAQYTGLGIRPDVSILPEGLRGPLIIYPTLTLGAEYNDNIFLNNASKESDFVMAATPGIRLLLNSPTYSWSAGYSFTAEKYLDHTNLDNVFQRQVFFVNGTHRLNPQLTLTLSEVFVESNDSNVVTAEGIAVGRRKARSNTFNPGLLWQFTPLTALRVNASYVLSRYDGVDAVNSDIYRAAADVEHAFTQRLTGIAGYELAYIDVDGQVGLTTHTPRIGATYRFTQFLTGSFLAGPVIRQSSQDTGISPFATASLVNRFSWGSAGLFFARTVGTAGGIGGTTENTAVGGNVQVTNLLRGLLLELAPRYNMSHSTAGNAIDVSSISIDFRASYQFTTWLAAVAGYRFFQQRSDSSSTNISAIATDVDQNRVFLGLQFGIPFRFD